MSKKSKNPVFIWTDYLVKKFAKISCGGQYFEYEGCKTMTQKLKRFKELHNAGNNNK